MTFPEWLESREGQDAVSDVFFGDKVQMTRALERAFYAGRRSAEREETVTETVERIATGKLTEGPQGHYTYQHDDLELSMADLPEGA